MFWRTTAALAVGLALAPAAPAAAGTTTTPNACRWSFDGLWRDQALDFTGTATPNRVAPGSGTTLRGASLHARLPDWVAQTGYNIGVLQAGVNDVPVKVAVALAGAGTAEGVQTRELTLTARTTVTTNPVDGAYVSATPFDVTAPIPDTAWTAGTAAAAFAQAAPGALAGATGSVLITATLSGLVLKLDCQPGSAPADGKSMTPGPAQPFETAAVDALAPPTPPPPAKPVAALRGLTVSGTRLKATVACAGAPCRGTVAVKAGKVALARRLAYSVAAGKRATVKPKLTAAGLRLLRARPSVKVRATLTPRSGTAVAKTFTLRRASAKPAVAHAAAAKRVVAIEWDTVENLHVLGMAPVGAADMRGYDTWVGIARPHGLTDIGSRQSPSLERIAALRPDLIVVPDFRASRNLAQLRKIAPVLITHPYPGGGQDAQFRAMVTDFRRLADAVGRRPRGEAILRDFATTLATLKARLKSRHRAGARVAVATPGGTTSSPSLRIFGTNSATAEAVRRLGLKPSWPVANARFGFSTVGVEGLAQVQRGWLAFVYPAQFRSVVQRFTSQSSFKRLDMARDGRVKALGGNTWLFGGPVSMKLFALRLAAALN